MGMRFRRTSRDLFRVPVAQSVLGEIKSGDGEFLHFGMEGVPWDPKGLGGTSRSRDLSPAAFQGMEDKGTLHLFQGHGEDIPIGCVPVAMTFLEVDLPEYPIICK